MKKLKVLFLSFILLINIQLLFAEFDSLKEAVESEETNKEYSFAGIQTIEDDLGELKGTSLTINGTQNINSVINSTGTYGINLLSSSSAQTLVVNNVSGFNNFKSAIVNKKNLSSVIVNNSVFNENKKALKGSAIYNLGYLEVNNSTFTFNSSSYGGAIINGDGASSIAQKREAHFSNVLFENNIAQTGGAVFNDVKGSMYMNNVVFSTNTSTGRDDKYAGGAVVNKGTMIITDYSNFTDNESNISGGAIENSGILNIYGFTEFIGNNAKQNGGAIFNSDYKDESTYNNTINISSGALFKENSAKNGGAVDNDGNIYLTANTQDITFIKNEATNYGGAIYNHKYSVVDLISTDTNNIYFTSNTATERGGAIYADVGSTTIIGDGVHFSFNTSKLGGAIGTITNALFTPTVNPQITIGNNVNFSSNSATDSGGAIYAYCSGVTIGDNAKFISNNADGSGGAFRNGNGRSVSSIGNNAQFFLNTASDGGAIYNMNSSHLSMGNNIIFSSNTAVRGGALRNASAYLSLGENTVFSFNKATESGAAIYNDTYWSFNENGHPGEITIGKNAEFSFNSADGNGGAIVNFTDTYSLQYDKNAILTVQDGAKFIGNSSNARGGAIYNEKGILNLIANTANIEFTGNTANTVSNAIHTSSGIINMWASTNADIIFNDRITSENNTSVLNINSSTTTLIANGKITLNEDMSGYTGTVNLYDGTLELKENNKFFNTDNFTIHGGTFTANASDILKGFINNGTVNFIGGTSNNEIIGTGKTEITGNVINSVNIIQSTITVLSGTLEHNIGNGENAAIIKSTHVIVNSEATLIAHSEIDTHTNNGKILNNGLINIDVRGEDEYIGNVKNYNVFEGEGELKITSTTFENYASIMQKKIVIADIDSELTTDLSNLIVTENITNDGTLILIGNGTNNNWISGNGTTIIDGEIINSSTIANTVTINTQKKLTTKLDEITGVIENNGELVFNNDGTNNNWISGNGTTIIDGEIINSSTIANTVTINTQKKLTTKLDEITGVIENNGELVFNNDGTNNNWISGNGTTIIDGEIINSSTIANTVTINTQKKLTTKLDEITGVIENNGELVFNNDGTNNNWISGNGITIIDGEVLNSSTIVNSVTINAQKKLTTNASDLTGNILNNGTLNFIGGINNNTVSGVNGTLVINDNLENNSEIVQSSVTINGIVTNKSSISAENIYLNGTFNLDANGSFFTATNVTACDGAEISLQNDLIQEHNFGNLTINSGLVNLVVDTDLENKKMDTISANEESSINGKIKVKAINILTDTKKFKTEILFTSSTVLKDKIETIDTVVSSKLFKYNVNYDENTGKFNFLLTTKPSPVVLESLIASNIGGAITQINIIGQAFASLDNNSTRYYSSKRQNFKSPNLYVSTANQIFETENKIERGLWIRPYAVQETVSFDNNDVDNTAIGTLAGIDLALSEESLVSFYLGYSGSNQKYEDIKINQTGYIVGATGMLVKEKWYAGITANINFNKASSESSYGTDDFDMNMYSIGAKAGYNFDIGKNWMLESNIMLMYGNINTQSYETSQGANIDSQSIINIIMEPQIKAKLQLEKGWQPYGLLGYVANMNDKAKIVVDEMTFEFDKIKGYVEYGVGVNKDFINTPWNCYVQATGRSGGRTGFAGNLGVKYKF